MRLHFTPEWLRKRIEKDGDESFEAGPDPIATIDLLVRVADTSHPDAAAAIVSAAALRRHLSA